MKIKNSLVIFAISLLALIQNASAVVIDLYSGNGVIGGTDSEITYLQGPANGPFGVPFTAADFANARSGPNAHIITNHPAWITPATFAGAGGNASANWISDNANGAGEGSTALYAIDFIIPFAAVATASLDFYWSVDNTLGDLANAGLFINGTAVPGPAGGGFGSAFSSLNLDVASLLVGGTNTLYVNSVDLGGPGGIIFSASLDVTERVTTPPPTGIPEPTTFALLSLAFGMMGYRKKLF